MSSLIDKIPNRICAIIIGLLICLNFDSVNTTMTKILKYLFYALVLVFENWFNIRCLSDFSNIYLQFLSALLTIAAVGVAVIVFLTKNYEKSLGEILLNIDEILECRIRENIKIVHNKHMNEEDYSNLKKDCIDVELLLFKYKTIYRDLKMNNKYLKKISLSIFTVAILTGIVFVTIIYINGIVNPLSFLLTSTAVGMLLTITRVIDNLDNYQQRTFEFPDYDDLIDLDKDGQYVNFEVIVNGINQKFFNAFSRIRLKQHSSKTKMLLNDNNSDIYYVILDVLLPMKFNKLMIADERSNSKGKCRIVETLKKDNGVIEDSQYITIDWKGLDNIISKKTSCGDENKINIIISNNNGIYVSFTFELIDDKDTHEVYFLPVSRKIFNFYDSDEDKEIRFCNILL